MQSLAQSRTDVADVRNYFFLDDRFYWRTSYTNWHDVSSWSCCSVCFQLNINRLAGNMTGNVARYRPRDYTNRQPHIGMTFGNLISHKRYTYK